MKGVENVYQKDTVADRVASSMLGFCHEAILFEMDVSVLFSWIPGYAAVINVLHAYCCGS